MTIMDQSPADAGRYEDLPDVSPIGAPLDWKWLRGAKSAARSGLFGALASESIERSDSLRSRRRPPALEAGGKPG